MFFIAIPSFKLASRTDIVRAIFGVPSWYIIYENEEQRLFNYIMTTETVQEGILSRKLDCSTICCERHNCFCAESEPVMCCSRAPKRRDYEFSN